MAVERIRATEVRVIGDLNALVPTAQIAPTNAGDGAPDEIPIDAVVELIVGLLVKARLAKGTPGTSASAAPQ